MNILRGSHTTYRHVGVRRCVLVVLVTAHLLLASQSALADQFTFTDSSDSIVRDSEEWRYTLPDIPRDEVYWIRFTLDVQNNRSVDVRLVDSVNDTMEQEGRLSSKTIHWKPDLRYVARYIVITPNEDAPDSHSVVFSWKVDVFSAEVPEEDEGPTLWEEHGLLIMGSLSLAAAFVLLTITLKAPGPDVGPEARQDMGSLRHYNQKMR